MGIFPFDENVIWWKSLGLTTKSKQIKNRCAKRLPLYRSSAL